MTVVVLIGGSNPGGSTVYTDDGAGNIYNGVTLFGTLNYATGLLYFPVSGIVAANYMPKPQAILLTNIM